MRVWLANVEHSLDEQFSPGDTLVLHDPFVFRDVRKGGRTTLSRANREERRIYDYLWIQYIGYTDFFGEDDFRERIEEAVSIKRTQHGLDPELRLPPARQPVGA